MVCRRDLGPAPRKPSTQEGVTIQHEVVFGQALRAIHRLKPGLGIGRHHVGLDRRLRVMLLERREVLHRELSPLGIEVHGDRRTEDREAAAEGHDLLLMQPEKRAVHQARHVPDVSAQQGVAIQRVEHGAQGGLDLDVLAARASGDLPGEMCQQHLRPLPAQIGGALNRGPGPLEAHEDGVPADLPQAEVAPSAILIAAILRHAAQKVLHQIGAHLCVAAVTQCLGGFGQVERLRLSLGLRHRLLHQGDQLGFHPRRLIQSSGGGILDAKMHEHGDGGVVAGNAQRLEIRQSLCDAPADQPAGPGEIVGGDTLVRSGVHHMAHEIHELRAPDSCDLRAVKDRRGLVYGADAQGGREYLHPVLLATEKNGFLEPCHGGLHARVVGRAVALELLILLGPHDLARSGHHLSGFLPVHPAQRLQDRTDFVPRQTRPGRERELALHVFGVEEQDAAGRLPVAAGASRLLQVVLERARNVPMHDEPNVWLVDAHAEGIGRSDDPKLAGAERLLHLALALGREARVEEVGRQALPLQELRHFLGRSSGGAVDDGTGRALRRQVRLDRVQDIGQFGGLLRRQNREGEVCPHGTTVEQHQLHSKAALEVIADVAHHLGLGRRREAQEGRHMVAGELLDEAADVAVVGPKVVPPFRNAVRLVKHPEPDLTLLEDRADGRLRSCSGEMSSMAASPIRTRSSASCRSGIDSIPLTVTAEDIPTRAIPCT